MTLRLAGHLGVRAPDAPLLRYLAGSADPVQQIALMARFGFAGISDNFLLLRRASERKRIVEALRHYGLAMGSFVHDPAAWNAPTWSARNPRGRDALKRALARSIAAAGSCGGTRINVVTGRDPARPPGDQLAAMVENLATAAEAIAGLGIRLCVEATHPSFAPGLLVERWQDALAVVKQVGHEAVGLTLDIGHIALHGEDPVAAIDASRDWIGIVQVADVPGRVEPGAGTLSWAAIIKALKTGGHDGLVELELEASQAGEAGERSMLAHLERLAMLPRTSMSPVAKP